MRGQPKRFSRNCLIGNGGNVILYVLVSFHIRDAVCTLSRLFVHPGYCLFFCSFGCSLFCRSFGFREFNQANFNSNECNGCVSVRYNSLFISLIATVYKSSHNNNLKQPHSAYLRDRELYDSQFLKFLSRILRLNTFENCAFLERGFSK